MDEKYIPLSQVVHAFERLQHLKHFWQDEQRKDPRSGYASGAGLAYDTAMDILLGSIPLLSKEVK